ncbi:MAG: ectoine/hydroxyectoine ABC transporter permease subunit EhuD [Actinomycetota bacterium]|nr:ectoine/hydroxyectoine ABC transporter permease subunit EhuD [Actinomycetota bacterium]
MIAATGPDTWDWGFAWEILPDLLRGLWVTVTLTVLGISLALVFGLVLALLRRSRFRAVRWPAGLFVEFIRGTPLLIQFFFLFYVLPDYGIVLSGFTVGVLGLGIHYACYTSETYRAGIESVPAGQWEAATAINLSNRQRWTSVILPQAIPTVLPALGNYLVAGFKDAPLAATVTVFGVLGTAQQIQGQTFRGLEPFTLAGLLFLAVSVPVASGVRLLERRHGIDRG